MQSEYSTADAERRHFITRFTGSAGTAVVTKDAALLWTDGRYFLQVADPPLSCRPHYSENWLFRCGFGSAAYGIHQDQIACKEDMLHSKTDLC